VKYQKGTHAFVDDYLLNSLIRGEQITHFYRPSERRWVVIKVDPVRKGAGPHPGRERRRTGHCQEMLPLSPDPASGDFLSSPSL
jgi:hypothetical protein